MREVVIVDAARSAVGRKKGTLGFVHPTDVLGQVLMRLVERNGLDPSQVDQVIGGCINKLGAQGMNVTRTAWLAHGGAEGTPTARGGRGVGRGGRRVVTCVCCVCDYFYIRVGFARRIVASTRQHHDNMRTRDASTHRCFRFCFV